jgi:hypothetical protein
MGFFLWPTEGDTIHILFCKKNLLDIGQYESGEQCGPWASYYVFIGSIWIMH